MILCIGKTPDNYALAKKLTGESNDELARHLLNEVFPFVVDEWLGRRNRPYNVNNLTGNFLEDFIETKADTVEVQQIVQDKLKAYKQIDNVDFPLVQKIISELFVKPEHFTKLLRVYNLTDHQLGNEIDRYKDFKLQLIEQIQKGTLSQENALKLGYINYKKQTAQQQTADKTNTQRTTGKNINNFKFYSGGAQGSDTEWAAAIESVGGKVKHFTVADYDSLTKEDKNRIEQEYQEVVKVLNRKILSADSYNGKLVRRDMMQANNSNRIVAIIEDFDSNGFVKGGTAYAVTRGIISKKDISVFNQTDNKWYTYEYQTGNWLEISTPVFTENTAVIGTRKINDTGRKAIQDVINKTLDQPSTEVLVKAEDLTLTPGWDADTALEQSQEQKARTNIVYNTEFTGKPLSIQLDDVKFKMSVQDKRAALDIIADSFYNIITKALQTSNDNILKTAKERNITPAKLRIQIERQNKELLSSIEKEASFKNPKQDFIKNLQSKVIPLTELDVIKTYGVENIVNIIRQQLANNPKTQLISDNFDALLRQAASKINNTYGINILGNTELFDDDNENEENTEDLTNTEHNTEGSKEDFTHADDKTRASERSLTKDLKLAYRQCFITNEKGQVITNSFGYKVPVDISSAHNKVLHLLEGMIDVTDVIPMLQKSSEGWVKQFIIKLQKNPRLLNQLYYCTKLSAQDYRIVYVKDGKLIQQSLNRLAQEELVANETAANVTNGILQTNKKFSIYTTEGKVNDEGLKNSKEFLSELTKDVVKAKDIDEVSDLDNRLRQVFKSLGITIPSTYSLNESIALYNSDNHKAGLQSILNNISKFYADIEKKGIINTNDNYLVQVFKFIGKSDVGYVESSVTENGKSYYTYSKTNYIDELLLNIKQTVKGKKLSKGDNYYQAWQQEHFGQSSFFKNPKTGEWYSDWMNKLFGEGSRYDKYRNLISRCSVLYTKGFDGNKVEFTRWSDVDSMTTNYAMYKEANPRLDDKLESNEAPAWYRMPIASDSNASDYIQFVRYINTENNTYDQVLGDKFWNICKQELVRIAEVTNHLNQKLTGEHTSADIKGYDVKQKDGIITDAGGMIFALLPQLNYAKVNSTEHRIFEKVQPQYRDRFNGISFLDALRTLSYQRSNNKIVTEPILEEDLKQFFLDIFYRVSEQDFNNEFDEVKPYIGEFERESYREYYYNYMNAWIQMVELTSTDTAFFGKRKVKEVNNAKEADFTHTRYIEENGQQKAVKHYYKIISDDTLSTFQKRNKEYHAPTNKLALTKPYFKEVYLNDIEIESEIKLNAINTINNNPNLGSKAKQRLISIWNKDVNVADGQSYRSLESYMELIEAKGQLTDEQRDAFNRVIKQHIWDEGDVNIIALAIKPYMYTTVPHTRSTNDVSGNKNVVMAPTQHKNSELPLAAALGAISASLNNSITLQALSMFVSQHSIDVVHFNSVVKVGETGTIDVDYKSKSVEEVLAKLEKACGFDNSVEGNPEIVHNIPTSSWGEQLSKPEHLLDAQQLVGSQVRRLILADLPTNSDYKIYINNKPYTVKEFKSHYQELITASLLEDFAEVDKIFKDPHKLEAFLQESIASSTKYDEDLLEMFTWDDANKRFKIPFWNRTVANRVEEILLALMKNRIGKQKIAGGAAVQTAAVGLTKELNVRYQKDGQLLDIYNDWLEKNPNGTAQQYEDYINGATLAYMEVYLPVWSKDLIEYLTDENGVIHYENLPEDLKYMVGYRIPTEDHYSCAPLYVKGFLSNLNASTIVVPADISVIAGSDYDIDVMYLMRHEFRLNKYDETALERDYKKAKDRYDTKNTDAATDKLLSDIFGIDESVLTPKFVNYQRWRNQHIWDTDKDGNRKYLLPKDKWTLEKIKYDTTKSSEKNNRKARNNEFIDTIIGCLQSPHSLDKFTNVGNYDELKIASRICEIINHPANTSSMKTLQSKSLDDLNDIVADLNKEKNLASPQTQTELHQQNMAGNQLKGIFVAAKSLQEVLQHAPMRVLNKFTINGNKSTKGDFTVGKLRASDGTLITKRFASYVAAAVDNGKDPLMNALKVSPKNANVVNYLTMLGYEPIEIGLFLNCVNIAKNISMSKEDKKNILEKYNSIYNYSALNEDMMSWAVVNKNNINDERVVAVALIAQNTFRKAQQQAQLLMTLARGLRADSMNFRKSVPENLQLIFAIDDFVEGNTIYNTETKSNDYKIFEPVYDKLPIKGASVVNIITKEQIKQNLAESILSYLQGFTDTLFTASTAWMEPYTLYTKGRMLDICKALNKYAGREAPQIISDFIDAYQRMSVLNLSIFGPDDKLTLSQKREYLVKDFPLEFSKFKQSLPKELKDNLFIDNIILVQPNRYDDNFHLEIKELGKNKDIRAKFKADCDRLAAYNPDIAMKLFLYTTFRNGFGYSQNGWAHLTSINFQENIPNYIETIDSMQDVDNNVIQDLFVQFLKNNYYKYFNLYKRVDGVDNIVFDGNPEFNPDKNLPIVLGSFGESKAVSFDGGDTWVEITPSLGSRNFYHEYFRIGEPQVSIFDDSNRAVETDTDNQEVPEWTPTDADFNELNNQTQKETQEISDKKSVKPVQNKDMIDKTGIKSC